MGYDLHITRSVDWLHASRYPIRAAEWMALVRDRADLSFDRDRQGDPTDDSGRTYWIDSLTDDEYPAWFMCYDGQIQTKNPDDATIRRMIEMAGILDAWAPRPCNA